MATRTVNFTTARLHALPAEATRYEVHDKEQPKLALRVTPAGVKTFSVFAWVPAKRRPERVTLGKFPGVSIDAARKRAAQILGQIAEGKSPASEKRALHAEDTFGDAFEKYMENHVRAKKLAKQTEVDTQGLYKNHIVPSRLHSRKLSDISHGDVEALHNRMGRKHPRTANKMVALVRAVFKYARKHGVRLDPPTVGIEQFTVHSRERFLLPAEMPRFYAALEETPQPHRDFFRLLLLTGARLGNVLAARFDQFDLDSAIWTVPGPRTKNRKAHAMALPPEAVEIAQRRAAAVPKGCPWLWPSTNNKRAAGGHWTTVRYEWTDLLARAEITDLRRHDIRRTVGAWLTMGGANMQTVGKALGHSSIHATQVYARLTLDPVRKAMAAASRQMDAAGKPQPGR